MFVAEFLAVQDGPSEECEFQYPAASHPAGVFRGTWNSFRLAPGQWTDDTSMGLCLADSLLTEGEYNGANVRVWFWNWYARGCVCMCVCVYE